MLNGKRMTHNLVAVANTREACRTGVARQLRLAAGLSLGDVASAIGVSKSGISRWERAQRAPRSASAQRYGHLLTELANRPPLPAATPTAPSKPLPDATPTPTPAARSVTWWLLWNVRQRVAAKPDTPASFYQHERFSQCSTRS